MGKKGEIALCRVLDELEKQGERRGEKRGERRGIKKGELLLSRLGQAMMRDGRTEELTRAFSDADYRKQLYVEYKIDQS